MKGPTTSRSAILHLPNSLHSRHAQPSHKTLSPPVVLRVQRSKHFLGRRGSAPSTITHPGEPRKVACIRRLLTSAAPHRRHRHCLSQRLPHHFYYARGCGEEERAQSCPRHRRQSRGRRAEAQRVPRLVSLRDTGRQQPARLTIAQV